VKHEEEGSKKFEGRFPRPPYEWRGIVAIILAVGVVVAVINVSFAGSEHLNPEEATTLSTVLGALTGALATFIGVSHSNGESHDKKEDEDE
jgi:hypothetical protein